MGDVVLGELLAARDGPPVAERPVEVWVARVGDGDTATVLALAHRLRERGVRVEYALRTMPLGKQLELASARGASYAVVIGPSERAAGYALVRDLGTGGEMRVDLSQLAESYGFESLAKRQESPAGGS
jgi:histidyl-tRNA synthetase